MTHKHKFAAVINCIDGRSHLPVINWVQSHLDVEFVDMITEPGPTKTLSQFPSQATRAIYEKAAISATAHGADTVAVVGHYDCAADPASTEKHHQQIVKSVQVITSWALFQRVIGLWINEKWEIEEVYESRKS